MARIAMTRRRFVATTAATVTTALGGIAKPHLSRASDRPLITHGLQSATCRPTPASYGRGSTVPRA
jgi:phosphodiesterase/alkaline phosphatase D-like protein